MSTFDRHGNLDPSQGHIVTCIGKKRSGKSVMGLLHFWGYPYDRVVIDVAADDGPVGGDIHELTGTTEDLSRRWPEHLRREQEPMTLRFVPDPGSPTYIEDMDAVVGLVMQHGQRTGHCGLLVHEMGVLAASNRVPPHTRRLLRHNRHNGVTVIGCMPRPITADPLVLAQSDVVYVFELPNPADRRRVAETIGWDPGDLDAAVHGLGSHEYLRFDANEDRPESDEAPDMRLIHAPALPEDTVRKVLRWARGETSTSPAADAASAARRGSGRATA